MEILTVNQKKVPTTSGWQVDLKKAIRDVETLLEFVGLSDHDPGAFPTPTHRFPILVPRPFAERIRVGDPNDPLLRQVLNFPGIASRLPDESKQEDPGNSAGPWTKEPLEDKSFEVVPGLLHKYKGRALLLTTGACAIHCRYCFRQNFDYSTSHRKYSQAIDYLKEQNSVREIILSGGDPLLKTDEVLGDLVQELEQVPNLRRLRIHTRTPVVLPSRMTSRLLGILEQSPLSVSIVLHINHGQEIDACVEEMIQHVRSHRILLFNQSVLLQGVNDSFDSQFQLCEKLVNVGVVPYYLHLLDKVQGAENYFVEDQVGRDIIRQLREELPGYAVPQLVRETPGHSSKTVIDI